MKKKIQQIFFVFQIIPSDFVALCCLYQGENTCHRHTVCSERDLRFCTSRIETFCRTIDSPVTNKCGKGAVLQM